MPEAFSDFIIASNDGACPRSAKRETSMIPIVEDSPMILMTPADAETRVGVRLCAQV